LIFAVFYNKLPLLLLPGLVRIKRTLSSDFGIRRIGSVSFQRALLPYSNLSVKRWALNVKSLKSKLSTFNF